MATARKKGEASTTQPGLHEAPDVNVDNSVSVNNPDSGEVEDSQVKNELTKDKPSTTQPGLKSPEKGEPSTTQPG